LSADLTFRGRPELAEVFHRTYQTGAIPASIVQRKGKPVSILRRETDDKGMTYGKSAAYG
jgi:hypothetical protein